MDRFWTNKNYSITAVGVIAAVFFATGLSYAAVCRDNLPHDKTESESIDESSGAGSVISSACGKIFRGDFESAQQIVCKSGDYDSRDIAELSKIIDEYMAIKRRRTAQQDEICQTQITAIEELRQRAVLDDDNDISEVFSLVLNIFEYADEEQKQALLQDPLLLHTVEKAKVKAAEYEAEGKWLDAYTICYGKLMQIYENVKVYSDYAKQLLEKDAIRASFQDNCWGTCAERYMDVEKQVFINSVDLLDFSYINIIDYKDMAIKAIGRCKLSAEVMSRLSVNNQYKITDAQYVTWSEALDVIVNHINQSQAEMGKDRFLEVFEQVLALNESPYTRIGLPQTLLTAKFAEGSLSALDPYTVIYWPSQTSEFEKALTNQFSGIGIKFSKQEGPAKVTTVFPDTPAYKSGLQMGDIIMAVDGIETNDISSDCLAKRIAGAEDTKVTLKIRHSNEDGICDISMDRAKIMVPSVHGWQRDETGKWLYMIDDSNKIGYIRISSFNARTADDLEEALTQLEEIGLKGLILDLRFNPGGLLSAAVEITDKFISEGLMLRTQPRCGVSAYISAHKEGTYRDCPIVVLVNQFTASASEILAGVLQDPKYKRAILVGQRTYGKGSVQSIMNCSDKGTQLKYTAAFYHLPSGQRVESRDFVEKLGRIDWGISPDVEVVLHSDELQRIADTQKANECLITKRQENNISGTNRHSSMDTVNSDPQLAVGLLVLKSKIIQSCHTCKSK